MLPFSFVVNDPLPLLHFNLQDHDFTTSFDMINFSTSYFYFNGLYLTKILQVTVCTSAATLHSYFKFLINFKTNQFSVDYGICTSFVGNKHEIELV